MRSFRLALRLPSANRAVLVSAAALALAGCDTIPTEPPKVNIVSDNFCAVSRKVTWEVTDTWQTIDEARRHNERIDRLCGTPGAKGKPAPATS